MFDTISLVLYLIVGCCVMDAYWNEKFKKEYELAKKSEEGVEEGMVSLIMLCLVVFWPLVLIVKYIRKWMTKP